MKERKLPDSLQIFENQGVADWAKWTDHSTQTYQESRALPFCLGTVPDHVLHPPGLKLLLYRIPNSCRAHSYLRTRFNLVECDQFLDYDFKVVAAEHRRRVGRAMRRGCSDCAERSALFELVRSHCETSLVKCTDGHRYGDDGTWSAISIRVGEPQQWEDVLVSTVSSETWVVGPGGCTSGGECFFLISVPHFGSTWRCNEDIKENMPFLYLLYLLLTLEFPDFYH